MMGFPFTKDPPPLGERETATLEFKIETSKLDSGKVDYFELAKDVAGFSNASGGTIFVGAVAKSDVLVHYKPLTEDAAKATARAFEEAVRDRCRPPPPPFSPRLIAHDGGFLVAVDVLPSAAVIAVKVKGSAADGYGEDAWVYFTRTTSHTKEFSPERLPMLMVPEIRRIAIMLQTILADPINAVGTGNAYIKYRKGSTFKVSYVQNLGSRIVSVDEEANTVMFAMPGVPGHTAFALDEINSVHRITAGWVVTLKQDSAASS
jgi:hypothetical protein